MLWFACILSVFSITQCLENSEISPNKAVEELYEKFERLQEEMMKVNQRLAATEKENQEMKTQIKHLRDENSICRKQISALENKINQVVIAKDTSSVGGKFSEDKVSNVSKDLGQETQQSKIMSVQNQSGLHKRLLLPGDTAYRIAFSVALTHDTPIGYHKSIEYDKIITNVGNVYDPNDGHFIAPYKGLYLLSATIMNIETNMQTIEMVRNGIQIAALYGDADDWNMSSQTIIVLLEQGDKVWVRKYREQDTASLAGAPNAPFNTFSGVLLFEM